MWHDTFCRDSYYAYYRYHSRRIVQKTASERADDARACRRDDVWLTSRTREAQINARSRAIPLGSRIADFRFRRCAGAHARWSGIRLQRRRGDTVRAAYRERALLTGSNTPHGALRYVDGRPRYDPGTYDSYCARSRNERSLHDLPLLDPAGSPRSAAGTAIY